MRGVRNSKWLLVGLVALVLVAGCSSKATVKTDGDGIPLVAPTGLNDENTCSIEGIVVDDEFNPVAGAQVGLLELPDQATVSAENGQFSFSYLDPLTYSVAVTKLGHKSALKPATCEAGAKVESFQVELPRIPDPQRSFKATFGPLKGRIACGVGHYAVATTDKCKETGIDPNGIADFAIVPETFLITGAVYELQWTMSSGLFGGRFLSLEFPGHKADQFEAVTDDTLREGDVVAGQSPINLSLRSLDPNDPLYQFKANSTMAFKVRPAGSATPQAEDTSKLVVGQEFSLYVALFYLDEPIPKDFTMLG